MSASSPTEQRALDCSRARGCALAAVTIALASLTSSIAGPWLARLACGLALCLALTGGLIARRASLSCLGLSCLGLSCLGLARVGLAMVTGALLFTITVCAMHLLLVASAT